MRVALAEDSALFRHGLELMLKAVDVEVVASEPDGPSLLAALDAVHPPDAVLLDIRMPPTYTDEGLTVAASLRERHPAMGILVLSTYAQTSYALRLMEHGAAGIGYLLKDRVDDVATLADALSRVTRGESVVDPEIVGRLLGQGRRSRELERLTEREAAVLRLMAEGQSNKGIAAALFLSARTVESHVNSVFLKLDLTTEEETNRRVLAVLKWLQARDDTT